MLFNSVAYLLFFPTVLFIYWWLNKYTIRIQNAFLLAVSYFFYSCWDWRFVFLLIFSTVLDYYTGIKMHEASSVKRRKIWLYTSIVINLGFLGVFKYYNFFAENFAALLSSVGMHPDFVTLEIVLPVGISFYTFHGLSYVLDIYYGRIRPCYNFVNYSLFVSFFPLLVAGPIERATHLLPQVEVKRKFDFSRANDGLRQILWGLFKKIVIADNCAVIANDIFNNADSHFGITLVAGALAFAFQIYGDFSGYSDIALGSARLMGFELLRNFSYPYFSRDIAEFWRRWHISLSSWFRDYLYIPLGGSTGSLYRKAVNVLIIFIVSGFWHGASWNFIVWGALNAVLMLPLVLLGSNRKNLSIAAADAVLPSFKEFFQIALTFSFTCLAWIFFRANNLTDAMVYCKNMIAGLYNFDSYLASLRYLSGNVSWSVLFFTVVMIVFEWVGRRDKYALEKMLLNKKVWLRWSVYYFLLIAIVYFGGSEQEFIYFQF
jgi:alginate O-acetyltransferase complex protein AlgI